MSSAPVAVKVIKAFGDYPVGFVMDQVPPNQAQIWVDRGLVRFTSARGGMRSPVDRKIDPARQAEVKGTDRKPDKPQKGAGKDGKRRPDK